MNDFPILGGDGVLPVATLIRPNNCGKCAFATAIAGDTQKRSECHRMPPAASTHLISGPNGQPQGITATAFPQVFAHQWCGEFKQRIAV